MSNATLSELKKQVDKFEESTGQKAEVLAVHSTADQEQLVELAAAHGSPDGTLFGCRVVVNGGMVPVGEVWAGTAATLDPYTPPPADEPFRYREAVSAGALPKADA